MDELQFSTKTVGRLVGASSRQLGHWASTGLLRPSGRDATGRGTRRRYTFTDIVALKAITALRSCRCPLQKIRAAIRHLRAHYPAETNADVLSRMTLLTDGKNVYLMADKDQVMEIVTHQYVWSVPIGLLILQAREQVCKLPTDWDETVHVGGKTYRLHMMRDAETGTFTVQCRELTAAISEGQTVRDAIRNGRDAIRTVLAFLDRRQRASRHVKSG